MSEICLAIIIWYK